MVERRIYRPAKYEKIIEKLTEDGFFETKQAVMMFAAATGHYLGKREHRDKAGEGIRWSTFEGNNDDAFIHALALAESGAIDILGRDRQEEDDDPIKVFEEYATAGLQYIQDKCVNAPGDVLDNLLSLIAEVNINLSDPPPGLEGLTPEALDFLAG